MLTGVNLYQTGADERKGSRSFYQDGMATDVSDVALVITISASAGSRYVQPRYV